MFRFIPFLIKIRKNQGNKTKYSYSGLISLIEISHQYMARPCEFDVSFVLEKGLEVFWDKGFEAASLMNLIEAMELSKSSFYEVFNSKHDLYISALNLYIERINKKLLRSFETSYSGLDFLERTFLEIADNAGETENQRGCFLVNTANQFA